MVNAKTKDPCKKLFIQLGIMSLPSLYIYHTLIEIHKNKPSYTIQSDVHKHNTRHASDFRIPRFRLNKTRNNCLDLQLYNCLPQRLRDLNKNCFKFEIKSLVLKVTKLTEMKLLLLSYISQLRERKDESCLHLFSYTICQCHQGTLVVHSNNCQLLTVHITN